MCSLNFWEFFALCDYFIMCEYWFLEILLRCAIIFYCLFTWQSRVIISSLHLSTYYIAHARLFHRSWLSGKQSTLQLLKVIPFLHSEKLGRENEIQCTFHVNDSHHQLFDMIHGSSNLAKVLNYYKGSFTNYVDKFLAFLTTYQPVDIFYLTNIDKKSTLLD